MLRQPFFKYSFIALLIIDISYAMGLIMLGIADISLDTLFTTAIWFVSFFWLPVWSAAYIIIKIRSLNVENAVFEWLITVIIFTLGFYITEQLLRLSFNPSFALGNYKILGGLTWGTPIYFITRFIESKQKISQEKQARKQAQLQTLRYQLNPHFMFNSLNTISAYIHSNPNLADEVLHELADILRYSLDTGEENSVSLQQEVTIINKYLNIEKARFGDRLIVNFTIPNELLSIQVPPLILQPIVENAIKHNAQKTALEITIKVEKTYKKSQAYLKITISDNGIGFNDDVLEKGFGNGVGMKNLQLRVQQLPQGKVTLRNSACKESALNNHGATVIVEMAL